MRLPGKFIHYLFDLIVVMRLMDETSSCIDSDAIEVFGVDSASDSVSTFQDDMGAVVFGEDGRSPDS